MMATEITSENLADATITAEPQQSTTIIVSQNVNSGLPHINGDYASDESRLLSDRTEAIVNSAEASVSGGSDTEATKAETSKGQGDEKGHVRNASAVKKPTSFKAVSVNKTFLAAKGAGPAKPGDKAASGSASLPVAPSTSLTPRPRLVAKSGSTLRDSAPRTAAAPNGGKMGSAPDANAVWNKNRPAAPPEQKRITDEELKQQYGIHLATRLQSDDPNKQANWADIDDDDDDWAPESIEWTDGTKITLPQVDEVASSLSKSATPPIVFEPISSESPKPRSPAPTTSTSSTIKLGGMSSGSGRGLVLKGAVEKPTLVAKPPGPPTPVKSPWASLPPVDKTAPMAIELQQSQQQLTRFSQKDPHGFENMQPPPAKEIAADDFSRSWREVGSNANRELFNSQSGRYEPVNDSRKSLSRGEVGSRQPAVLQRPLQQDQQGPAEPSPAFQTHRASGQDGSYGRRRASSTVSGGSGNFVRRMSKGQEMHATTEIFDVRRSSMVVDSPVSPNISNSSIHQPGQRGHTQQSWQSRASPSISQASPVSTHAQMAVPGNAQSGPPIIPFEDEIELQKKIMRETRELARKRRLEEEAREEAERKERIRLKLEAMGPPPESKKNKKEVSKEEKDVPTQIQTRDIPVSSVSPPKPPVTEVDGEIKQYGMMKVHPPESISSQVIESKPTKLDDTRTAAMDVRTNGVYPNVATRESAETQQPIHENRQSQSWQKSASSATDRYTTWSSSGTHSAQGRNVWGPPTNDRTLGNGTFNPDLSRLPEIHNTQAPQMAVSGPGPIGPPNQGRVNGQYQGRVREQFTQRPAPIGPPQRPQDMTIDQQQRLHANTAWGALPEKLAREEREEREKQEAIRLERQASGIEKTQPQPVYKDTWKQVVIEDGVRSSIKSVSQTINDGSDSAAASSWNDYAAKVAQDEAAEFARQESAWRQRETSSVNAPQPVYKETWRQVQVENGVRNDVLNSATTINNGSQSTTLPPSRGSRFFPQSKDIYSEDHNNTFNRPGSPSPPPPTMADHPAFDGNIAHPQVSLPRPPPIVRLPPPKVLAPIGPPKPIASFAAAVATPVIPLVAAPNPSSPYQQSQKEESNRYRNDQMKSSRPSHTTGGAGDWQDRINHLIGRRTSPKTHVLAVDSSSKNALEVPTVQVLATVSLPSSPSGLLSEDEALFETKPMAEECFEEQEMGSLPPIRVPNKAPEAAWHLVVPQVKPLPRRFVLAHVTSIEPLSFSSQITKEGNTVHIFLPGMMEEKLVNLPIKKESRQGSNGSRHGKPRGGTSRHTSSSHPRSGRARDPSSSFSPPGVEHMTMSPSPTSSARGGARSRGSYGSQWNSHRHTSTPNSIINV